MNGTCDMLKDIYGHEPYCVYACACVYRKWFPSSWQEFNVSHIIKNQPKQSE